MSPAQMTTCVHLFFEQLPFKTLSTFSLFHHGWIKRETCCRTFSVPNYSGSGYVSIGAR